MPAWSRAPSTGVRWHPLEAVAQLPWKCILAVSWLTRNRPSGKAASGGMLLDLAYRDIGICRRRAQARILTASASGSNGGAADNRSDCGGTASGPTTAHGQRRGYRNGTKPRRVTGTTGPLAVRVPRADLFTATPLRLAPYDRLLPEVNETVIATSLAGANSRRRRAAFPLVLAQFGVTDSCILGDIV
jgi:hypothetical protein